MLLYSRTAQNIDGDWVAIGVWRFGTLIFIVISFAGPGVPVRLRERRETPISSRRETETERLQALTRKV